MKKVSFIRRPLAFEGRYTQIPNTWARDERLGFRARGILLLLMSHQDGWRISLEHLAGDSPDGITSVRTAILQLEEFGYLIRSQTKNDQNRFDISEWQIIDPFENAIESPSSEKPTTEKPTSENLTHKKPNILETQSKETNIEKASNEFERFWKLYPRRIGKRAAQTSFEKAIKKVDAEVIFNAIENYINSGKLPEMQYIPFPATWLNQERWHDDISAIATTQNNTTTAADIIRRSAEMQGWTANVPLELE